MPVIPRISTALTAASLLAAGVAAIVAACGGGTDPSGMGMASPTASTGMSCMSMDMSMSCPPPTITMVSPGAVVHRTVTLTADVGMSGGDMMIMMVDFLVDGVTVGMATQAPYTISWDTTAASDGNHKLTAQVSDNMDHMVTSKPVSVQVNNNPTFTVAMTPGQLIPAPASSASATATLAAKLANGALSGKVMLSGLAATSVTLNDGFAGSAGSGVIALTANGGAAGEWDVPSGAMLTDDQMTALMQGGLYVVAVSAAHPGGEVRGQITPANVMVTFSTLQGSQEVPPVSSSATGVAATTVDTSADTLTVHLHTSGVADAMAANVDNGGMGATGSMLTALSKDDVDPGHWSTQLATIGADDVANFKAGKWYLNVASAVDPNGVIRGQIQLPGN
jgi:hypothetical protein